MRQIEKENENTMEFTKEELENEVWRDIPLEEFSGRYQVSSLGRIRSLDYYCKTSRGDSHRLVKGRIRKLTKQKSGYMMIGVCVNKKNKNYLVHRIVAFAFLQEIEGKDQINHIDENKKNNRVSNLEWCTAHENLIHNDRHLKVAEKRKANGTYDQADKQISIRAVRGNDQIVFNSVKETGEYFGVNPNVISAVLNGRTKRSRTGYRFEYA